MTKAHDDFGILTTTRKGATEIRYSKGRLMVRVRGSYMGTAGEWYRWTQGSRELEHRIYSSTCTRNQKADAMLRLLDVPLAEFYA